MKIHRIELENFRKFEHYSCQFGEQLTLIEGNQGSGKTSLIEALAIAAGSLFLGFDDITPRNIQAEDLRQFSGETPLNGKQYHVQISTQGMVQSQLIEWQRILKKPNGRTTGGESLLKISQELQAQVRKGSGVILPLVVYYGDNRQGWHQRSVRTVKANKPQTRTLGNCYWFNQKSPERRLLEWFKMMKSISQQEQKPWQIFVAVQEAIASCLDLQTIQYDLNQDKLFLNGQCLFEMNLSQRHLAVLVADIAYRAVVLNPQLTKQAIRETPGIVLIDDICLHLDAPVVESLLKHLPNIFPCLQFIATTPPFKSEFTSLPSLSLVQLKS
ncbi:AAA family ATPase [Laspinema olomoucense]|uniref:AAA family ATPase n=1 Tax=Laspinema olomoucense TaxID=3231600 RepID=UPI0021BAE660|nr:MULTISPECIES: AAA family ATPase [unclassified Laspinema]MCT7970535.1 AAA family ATPase [Laspinema sp. D3d]MCT7991661.1 AAA family ATPase [Laspinema sp. D3a]